MEKITERDRCCGTCAFWRPVSDFEGVCVSSSGLSANIDVTEVRYFCAAYKNTLAASEEVDFEDD